MVGTHALITPEVRFAALALTVVDELGATATVTKMVTVQGGPGCSG